MRQTVSDRNRWCVSPSAGRCQPPSAGASACQRMHTYNRQFVSDPGTNTMDSNKVFDSTMFYVILASREGQGGGQNVSLSAKESRA
jgi:hypothetical protein